MRTIFISRGFRLNSTAAPRIKPNRLILCSLSAFFYEDLPNYESQYLIRRLGKSRTDDFRHHVAKKIAQQILEANIETNLLYGEKEKSLNPILVSRVRETAAALKSAHYELLGAGHKMREPEYASGLRRVLAGVDEA